MRERGAYSRCSRCQQPTKNTGLCNRCESRTGAGRRLREKERAERDYKARLARAVAQQIMGTDPDTQRIIYEMEPD